MKNKNLLICIFALSIAKYASSQLVLIEEPIKENTRRISIKLIPFRKKNGKYIYVDSLNMKPAIKGEFNQAGFFDAKMKDAAEIYINGKSGFADTKGNYIIPPSFHLISGFYNKYAWFKLDGKFGIINDRGKIIVPAIYESINRFNRNIFAVRKKEFWGLIDNFGKIILPLEYENISPLADNNIYSMVQKKSTYGLVNNKGKIIIPVEYNWIGRFFFGLATVQDKNNKYGFLNESGKLVIPFKYDQATDFQEGFSFVTDSNTSYFINTKGEPKFNKGYSMAYGFDGGLCILSQNRKHGVIDITGNTIIPFIYESIRPFHNGYATVYNEKYKQGLIDKKGNLVIPFNYDYGEEFSVENNITAYSRDGLCGLLNVNGSEIIKPTFKKIKYAGNNLYAAKNNDHWGILNEKGKVLTGFEYNKIITLSKKLILVQKNESFFIFELSGRSFFE
jgi:WG containing repeat